MFFISYFMKSDAFVSLGVRGECSGSDPDQGQKVNNTVDPSTVLLAETFTRQRKTQSEAVNQHSAQVELEIWWHSFSGHFILIASKTHLDSHLCPDPVPWHWWEVYKSMFAWWTVWTKLAISSSGRSEFTCFSKLRLFKEWSKTGKILFVHLSTSPCFKRVKLLFFFSMRCTKGT